MGKTRKASSQAYYRLTMSKKHQGINNNLKKKRYIQGIVVLLFPFSKHVIKKYLYTV